ncbi:MAG: hypothetical protein M3Y71_05370 [Actinomycetota bacterium]|nr:hypothetical protein [Actinomycetota bacterium]
MNKTDREFLSLGYRIGWKIRSTTLNIFGPAQIGRDDPQTRLLREREAKVAAARRQRGPTGSDLT